MPRGCASHTGNCHTARSRGGSQLWYWTVFKIEPVKKSQKIISLKNSKNVLAQNRQYKVRQLQFSKTALSLFPIIISSSHGRVTETCGLSNVG
jgi:hypothetical protein